MTKRLDKLWNPWYKNLAYPSFMEGASVQARRSSKDGKFHYRTTIFLPDCCDRANYVLTEHQVKELWKFLSGHYKKESRHFPCAVTPTDTFCVVRRSTLSIMYGSSCFDGNQVNLSDDDLKSMLDWLKMLMVQFEKHRDSVK